MILAHAQGYCQTKGKAQTRVGDRGQKRMKIRVVQGSLHEEHLDLEGAQLGPALTQRHQPAASGGSRLCALKISSHPSRLQCLTLPSR
jgi:hypothetical protein